MLIVLFSGPAQAAAEMRNRPSEITSPPALVRAWHREFFHREPDAREVAGWSYWFRLGRSRQQVLAALLSTDEYLSRAGDSPEELVEALFEDGARREPSAEERESWSTRARSMSRDALAVAFLQNHPEALRARPQDAYPVVVGRRTPGVEMISSPARSRRPAEGRPVSLRR
jgi:hypothetical protein